MLAIVLIMVVKSIEGAVSDPVSKDAALWPLAYVPGAVGLGIGALLLWIASRGSRSWLSLFRRRAA